jgi:hypothetical protein
MPIDEALGDLEGVPEHVLNKKFPESIRELAKIYKKKFKIDINQITTCLEIESIIADYKNFKDNGKYFLNVYINLSYPYEKNITITLHDECNSIQTATERKTAIHTEFDHTNTNSIIEEQKLVEKWFYKMKKYIHKEIPELEEFVKREISNNY